jgi:hypothetical protein
MLADEAYEFSPEAAGAFRDYLERRIRQPRFAHARSVRNAIERARLRHANRVYQAARRGGTPSREELVRIEAQDILASSVFKRSRAA